MKEICNYVPSLGWAKLARFPSPPPPKIKKCPFEHGQNRASTHPGNAQIQVPLFTFYQAIYWKTKKQKDIFIIRPLAKGWKSKGNKRIREIIAAPAAPLKRFTMLKTSASTF